MYHLGATRHISSILLFLATRLLAFILYYSTKGVGATAPDPSEAQTLDDGVIVPLGKPKEQKREVCLGIFIQGN